MRVISENVELILAERLIKTYYLFSFIGSTLDLRYTTHFSDITISGLGTFLANNTIASFEPPMMERATNRESYKLTFVDSDFTLRTVAESNIVGSRVKVYLGFLNPFGTAFGGANPDMPLLNPIDLILAFDGVIDTKQYAINSFEKTAVFSMECTTPMGSFNAVNPYITSKNFIKNIDPTDTSYDQIYDKAVGLELLWGKIPPTN
jgi:hypothetical protein